MSDLAVRSCRAGLLVLAWLVAAPAEAQRIPAAAAVDTVRPAELVLLPGQTIALDLYGRRLRQARGVLVERNRTTTDDVTGRLDCRSNQLCLLQVAVKRRARAARYRLFLADADRQPLLEVPVRLLVAVPPRGEEPDRIVTLEGEPGVSVQRSCTPGPYSTDVALLEPEANGGLVVGTELVWQRAEHEMCAQQASGKQYRIGICGVPNVNCNITSAQYVILVDVGADYIGNGRVIVQSDLNEIANETGVGTGGTVYWQVRYEYTGAAPQGDWTPTRPLTFNVPDPEPEPEPDPPQCPSCPAPPVLFQPAANTALHATNRNFSWSQTAGAQSWDLCFILPPATSCAQTLRRTQASLSGLTFEDFEGLGLTDGPIEWQVRACNAQNACGGYSAPRTNFVPTAPAERVYPPHRAEASAPRTFIWREVDGADFYRLIVNHGSAPANRQVWFDGLTGTSHRLTLADFALLGSPSSGTSTWWVRPCWEPGGGIDPVCADSSFAPFETVGVSFVKFRGNPQNPGEVSFDAFIDAFRAGSCTRCHAVAAAGGGFPADHPSNEDNCTGCHQNSFLPPGTHAIPWQAAPGAMDLRNLSDAQLCARAQDRGSIASDPGDHLAGDPLILWAVDGGQLPLGNGYTEKAWPGTLAEWQQLVRDWNDNGRACEPPS